MKIKNWEDLDGKENKEYSICFAATFIRIYDYTSNFVIDISIKHNTENAVLTVLKLYGFEFEFEKPQITRWEKAKKENWNLATLFNEFFHKCQTDSGNRIRQLKDWLSELVGE